MMFLYQLCVVAAPLFIILCDAELPLRDLLQRPVTPKRSFITKINCGQYESLVTFLDCGSSHSELFLLGIKEYNTDLKSVSLLHSINAPKKGLNSKFNVPITDLFKLSNDNEIIDWLKQYLSFLKLKLFTETSIVKCYNSGQTIPLYIEYTAGMRGRSFEQQEIVLKTIEKLQLLSSKLQSKSNIYFDLEIMHSKVISGVDEALSAWVAKNQQILLHNSNTNNRKLQSSSIFEFGGSSTQFAMEVSKSISLNLKHVFEIKLGNKIHYVYGQSIFGGGLIHARNTLDQLWKSAFGEDNNDNIISKPPCYLSMGSDSMECSAFIDNYITKIPLKAPLQINYMDKSKALASAVSYINICQENENNSCDMLIDLLEKMPCAAEGAFKKYGSYITVNDDISICEFGKQCNYYCNKPSHLDELSIDIKFHKHLCYDCQIISHVIEEFGFSVNKRIEIRHKENPWVVGSIFRIINS